MTLDDAVLKELEVLRLKPGEKLIIRLPSSFPHDTAPWVNSELRRVLGNDNFLLFIGDVEFTVQEPS